MKLFVRPLAVLCVLVLLGALSATMAQTVESTTTQITSSTRDSFPGDISGDGRFIVIESTGDIATESPDNADGNREIFLFDYAQRRIFQITRTRSALKTVSPTPTPAPTPTATPAPGDPSTIDYEVSNNKPVISHNGRWIAFSSNAANPASFDGNDATNRAALAADGNQEIFLYLIPAAPAADLASGQDAPFVDLAAGTFTRVTNTPASRVPVPGSGTGASALLPFVAFDNRDVSVNDNASVVAFVSTRNLPNVSGLANADGNPELFVFNRISNTISQLTSTQGNLVFNENPSLSGDGSALAFISNANLPETAGASGNNSDGNAEVYLATLSGGGLAGLRQVTRTTAAAAGASVNFLSPGRRLSRNGAFLAFESLADLGTSNANQTARGLYLYNVAANSFTRVGPRASSGDDVLRYPTFTGDSTTLLFSSALNFRADGTAPTSATDGLNPGGNGQIFSAAISAPNSFTRLTNTPAASAASLAELAAHASDTVRRIAFGIARNELGGGNADNSTETFYLNSVTVTSEVPASSNAIVYATGASQREIVAPAATPAPPAVAGLAPGLLAFARSTTATLAPASQTASGAGSRRPGLPVELGGVSVSIRGAAAGLYAVAPGEIRFVVPPGLAATSGTSTYPLTVINTNTGAVVRSTVQVANVQPDLFTSSGGAGGRATALNVTNPLSAGTPEPFTVTTTYTGADGQTKTEATILRFMVTGISNAQRSQVTVRIKDTDLTGDAIIAVGPSRMPGFDQVDVRLPASLAGAGDVPVIITISGVSSRPAESAPFIRIQ